MSATLDVLRGLVADLRAILRLHAQWRAERGPLAEVAARRFRLGRLLVDSGAVDESAITQALERGRRSGKRLGESLVEAGVVSTQMVEAMLARQRRLTRLALAIAALSSFSPLSTAAGHRVTVTVTAAVQAYTSIESQNLPSEVMISPDDVSRGYVDLQRPVEIAVRTNDPGGAQLQFAANVAEVAGVDVDGVGATVRVTKQGRGLQRQQLRVRLRLLLRPDAMPGKVVFPVSVGVTPP